MLRAHKGDAGGVSAKPAPAQKKDQNGLLWHRRTGCVISYRNPTTVYFQAANNSIMQLSVVGETSATNITGVMAVGEGAAGTRIGFIDSTIDTSFCLCFQNGSYLVQSPMERNNLTGEAVPGNTSFVSAVIFGDGVKRSLIVSPLLIFLCSVLGLHLLL
jgi:hypothetical protein